MPNYTNHEIPLNDLVPAETLIDVPSGDHEANRRKPQ